MFCSGCGQSLEAGEIYCPRCGRATTSSAPTPLAMPPEAELFRYEQKIRALSIAWFAWAGLSLAVGFAGLTFANALFSGRFGQWGGIPAFGDRPEMLMLPGLLHFIWIAMAARVALLALTGWGLWRRTRWGRILAIVMAILSLFRFPLGTAVGVVTLVFLLGGRNSSLYGQLEESGPQP